MYDNKIFLNQQHEFFMDQVLNFLNFLIFINQYIVYKY